MAGGKEKTRKEGRKSTHICTWKKGERQKCDRKELLPFS